MSEIPLSNAEVRDILRRQEQLQDYQPACPACASGQVQIMSKGVPARWRCRRCKRNFKSEPTK